VLTLQIYMLNCAELSRKVKLQLIIGAWALCYLLVVAEKGFWSIPPRYWSGFIGVCLISSRFTAFITKTE